VALSDLSPPSSAETVPVDSTAVRIGLDVDSLEPVQLDLADGPHFLITGPHGSGKTTLLQSWLLALADRLPPERFRLYLVNIGGYQLLPFGRLPHAEGQIDNPEQLPELLAEIRAELEERRRHLDHTNRESGGTLHSPRLSGVPHIVIAIDDFDQFRIAASDSVKATLESITRQSRGLAIHLIIAGPTTEFVSGWDPLGKAIREWQRGVLLGSTEHTDLGVFNLRVPSQEAGRALAPGRGYVALRGRHIKLQAASCHAGSPVLPQWLEQIAWRYRESAGHPPGAI
jgi:S-DNA-T family DNA segregation ATPase FtsK/SpoIIIE